MNINDFDKRSLELLKELPNRQSKHCFRSAINHLELAEKLFQIDSSMAVFRCITAEEEAATGLIYCLKDRGYINADKLNPRNHVHKNAFIPFLRVLCQFVEDSFKQYQIETFLCHKIDNKKVRLKFEASMISNGQQIHFAPEPPFNFELLHEGKQFSYKPQIQKLVKSKNVKNIKKHIEENAELRNKVLYATPKGFPAKIKIEDNFFPTYLSRVIALLRTYLLIEPYKIHQPFVQDSLNALLAMINTINPEVVNLHEHV